MGPTNEDVRRCTVLQIEALTQRLLEEAQKAGRTKRESLGGSIAKYYNEKLY